MGDEEMNYLFVSLHWDRVKAKIKVPTEAH